MLPICALFLFMLGARILNCCLKIGYLPQRHPFINVLMPDPRSCLLVSVCCSISTPLCVMFHVLNIFMMETPAAAELLHLTFSLLLWIKQRDSEKRVAEADRDRELVEESVRDVANYIVNSNPATNASRCVCVAVIPDAQLSVSVQPAQEGFHVNSPVKSGAKFC